MRSSGAKRIGRFGTALITSLCVISLQASLAAAGADAETATEARRPAEGPKIVNGVNGHDQPTTGALMYAGNRAINANNAGSWCTGTLIGCRTFLTAAHCVEDDANPSHYWVFLQNVGTVRVTSITPHPSYTSQGFPAFDIAVLKLEADVTGVDPTELPSAAPAFGTEGTIAGFGQTDGSAGDYGILRTGKVVTASCPSEGGVGNNELVCWNFQNPVGPAGEDSNTCNGDSGGPLFVNEGGVEVVAGVTSGGTLGTCLAGDSSYDANVYTFRNFVLGQLGTDSTGACGSLPAVGAPDVSVEGFDGQLSGGGGASASHDLTVSGTPNEVRVTLKGEDDVNAEFFVKTAPGASPADFDCQAGGNGSAGACVFSSPPAGSWSVFVRRTGGAGEYQVTSTVFGGDPPVCGNDLQESGEACDGTDDAACPGACGNDCSCPPPVCGNGIVELGEMCDGAAAGLCPTGICASDCTCPAPVCGNDVVEEGETCDGASDAACPGACSQSCGCPATCSEDIFAPRARATERRFNFRIQIDNTTGAYDGLDPRDGFTFTVSQGGAVATVHIPAGDAGWGGRPDNGRFVWRGDRDGLRSVRVVDRTARRGVWDVRINGRSVPGAGGLDLISEFADLNLSVGASCFDGLY